METKVGLPVQFFEASISNDGRRLHPAIISFVRGGKVDIRVFPNNGGASFVERNVRHADFEKSSEHYWDLIDVVEGVIS